MSRTYELCASLRARNLTVREVVSRPQYVGTGGEYGRMSGKWSTRKLNPNVWGGAVGAADVYVSKIKVFLFYLFCFVLG